LTSRSAKNRLVSPEPLDTRAPGELPAAQAGNALFLDYFRCPGDLASIQTARHLSPDRGYFAFAGATCFGRRANGAPARRATRDLPDVIDEAEVQRGSLCLPFDLAEVVTNLREELYEQRQDGWFEGFVGSGATRALYYTFRPFLPVGVRKHLQRLRFAGWQEIAFPKWPIDDSVDQIMRATMALLLKREGVEEMPFIWFWPAGAPACVMVTHDVEGAAGRMFCERLADIDASQGIRSAFQMIPRNPLEVSLMEALRRRDFEVNLHDLEHDGSLFHDRETFNRRVADLNKFARQYGCRGFRSGAMYREQTWFKAMDFAYDMSVPNAAHLEPQRGGCCTVMPYFIGDLLELPLTTTQDYTLFHILGEYSNERWRGQTRTLLSKNGLISFIAHPDYLTDPRAEAVYRDLLMHLSRLRAERSVWVALPGEVNDWWRTRQRMSLVANGASWRIVGPGSERACVAYAALDGENVSYRIPGVGNTTPNKGMGGRSDWRGGFAS
jgi:hypothetical protein